MSEDYAKLLDKIEYEASMGNKTYGPWLEKAAQAIAALVEERDTVLKREASMIQRHDTKIENLELQRDRLKAQNERLHLTINKMLVDVKAMMIANAEYRAVGNGEKLTAARMQAEIGYDIWERGMRVLSAGQER